MSASQARRDEINAKKAKLAELKRQREQRSRDLQTSRQSLDAITAASIPAGGSSDHGRPSITNRADLDSLISSLVDRPGTPKGRESSVGFGDGSVRQGSAAAAVESGNEQAITAPRQVLGLAQLRTIYDSPAEKRAEVITYSKGIQTDDLPEDNPSARQRHVESGSAGSANAADGSSRERKRLSYLERERQKDYDLRAQLRKEIEEEIKAVKQGELDSSARFPARQLTPEELHAVNGSAEFLDFVEHSSKVIERALAEDYDILIDYAQGPTADGDDDDDDDDDGTATRGRRGRRIKEVMQFQDEQYTKRRMLSDLDYSPKYPELLLASYTKATNSPQSAPGLALVWNSHNPAYPEHVFTASSDLLCARFSPYHPNIVLAGTYSGQVCMWDTRARSSQPTSLTPLAGERGGHAHPIYSLAVVGGQNASNIVSVSTDGTACAWGFDMLSKPQEHLFLTVPPAASRPVVTRTEDVAPTRIAFPAADPTYFLAGTEEGSLLAVHRYDRAGARAGVDPRVAYRAHAAPVSGLHFHPNRGRVDLGDLVLSCALDWSVKLWRARPHGAGTTAAGAVRVETPLLDIAREDVVYDVKWSPTRAGVFGCVDGAGRLDVFDLAADAEGPVASVRPGHAPAADGFGVRSLNKLAWEHTEGKRVAVGGLDGVVTVFEVGAELGGPESLARTEEWTGMKKLVQRWEKLSGTKGKETAKTVGEVL